MGTSIGTPALWIGFTVLVIGLLALDLGVFHRKAHQVRVREALIWTVVWVALALLFNVGVYHWFGAERGLEFLTGYLIEKALSVDNLFVFLVLFSYFAVPPVQQHRVLFWGVLGALVMRALFIAVGAALLAAFHWVIYLFGGILVVTAVKLAVEREAEPDPARNPIVRLFRRLLPATADYHGSRFFVRENGRLLATPLLLVLVTIEASDVVFALDSIPAIFAVTRDPFIVYTSNIFAILGLRSLFFVLAGAMGRLRYLKIGLAVVLGFVGVKMIASGFYKVPIAVSLGVIAGVLFVTVVASLIATRRDAEAEVSDAGSEGTS